MTTLIRAAVETGVEGRTLLGMALPWERPALVSDYGGTPYLEDFGRACADKTLAQNPHPQPVDVFHQLNLRGALPVGVVSWEKTSGGLMFRAFVSKTRAGDESLELVRDGAMTDVSATFRPINKALIRTAAGVVTRRTEIALRGLTLAPTGYGQIPGAGVLAMRADMSQTFGDIQDAVTDAIGIKLFGADGPPDGVYVNVPYDGIGDGWVVYCVEGGALDKPELNDLWRVDYVIGADGTVTLSDAPVRVEKQYVPLEVARSETPRLDRYRRLSGR